MKKAKAVKRDLEIIKNLFSELVPDAVIQVDLASFRQLAIRAAGK